MDEHQTTSKDASNATNSESARELAREALETTCCIVEGGPAGVVLSLLLARQGVPVTLLEAH